MVFGKPIDLLSISNYSVDESVEALLSRILDAGIFPNADKDLLLRQYMIDDYWLRIVK